MMTSLLTPKILFDFNKKADIQQWFIVDDGVMGGRSSGNFSLSNEGYGVFEGNISLDNNGGFSSLRYNIQKTSVKEFTKISLKLKGDGKKY
ncbi:MAG: CIA30 family protein, partial [Polaribacter sp.]|nr:CIA30 family protein [Polaribacter sp.]